MPTADGDGTQFHGESADFEGVKQQLQLVRDRVASNALAYALELRFTQGTLQAEALRRAWGCPNCFAELRRHGISQRHM